MSASILPWSKKFAPLSISECVLPTRIRELLGAVAAFRPLPHLLISGPAGSGKSTMVRLLATLKEVRLVDFPVRCLDRRRCEVQSTLRCTTNTIVWVKQAYLADKTI